MHNGLVAMTTPPNEVLTTGDSTTLLVGNPQPSDVGDDYVCVFNDTVNGWTLSRNIVLQELCKYDLVYNIIYVYAHSCITTLFILCKS